MKLQAKTTSPKTTKVQKSDEVFYPDSDGKPMAETDLHRKTITRNIDCFELFFANQKSVYVTRNIMFYYEEGNPLKSVSPDVMVVKVVEKKERHVFKLWEE